MINRILLTTALYYVTVALHAQPVGEPRYLPTTWPAEIKEVRAKLGLPTVCVGNSMIDFRATKLKTKGRTHGFHAFRYDPSGGSPTIVRELDLPIPDALGGYIAAMPMNDHVVLSFWQQDAKTHLVRIMAMGLDPVTLETVKPLTEVGQLKLNYHLPDGFTRALAAASPGNKHIAIFFDQLSGPGNKPLMACWVFTTELEPVWNGIYARGWYDSHGMDAFNRKVYITDKGTMLVLQQINRPGGPRATFTDPRDQTEPILSVIRGESFASKPLNADNMEYENPELHLLEDGIYVTAIKPSAKGRKESEDWVLMKLSEDLSLSPIASGPATRKGEMDHFHGMPNDEGGWYLMWISSAHGLEAKEVSATGEVLWAQKAPRWKHRPDQVFHRDGALWVMGVTGSSGVETYLKGKDLTMSGGATLPSCLRIRGDGEPAFSTIFPAERGGGRDINVDGWPRYTHAATCGCFAEPSRDPKKPGHTFVELR